MITIICGENTLASREYFLALKRQYKNNGYEIRQIKAEEVESINQWLADSPSLFSQKRIFFSEHLNTSINKNNKKLLEELRIIEKAKEVEFIVWEDVSLWELKLKKIGFVKEFKPDQTIFMLQESLFPGNKKIFLNNLERLSLTLDQNFIFIMLVRYVRNLIIIKSGGSPPGVLSWQIYRMQVQADSWEMENLISFYESMFRVEMSLKTSSNPFNLKESLEILACHFI